MKFTASSTIAVTLTMTMLGLAAIRTSAFAVGRTTTVGLTSSSQNLLPRVSKGTRTSTIDTICRQRCIRYMTADASALEFTKSEIDGNEVVVFSKSFCPFCKKTKKLLNKLEVDAKIIELDEIDNGPLVQDALLDITGQRTVPNVFIKGEHMGGNDDMQKAAKSGVLQEKLGI